MNLMLHGIDRPDLGYKDTLSKSYTEVDRYDVVLANPPFKGSIDMGDINEELRLKTTKTELLFVTTGSSTCCVSVDGQGGSCRTACCSGRATLHKDLRKMLMEECKSLQGIVKMPSGRVQTVRWGEHRGADLREGRKDGSMCRYYDMQADWSLARR